MALSDFSAEALSRTKRLPDLERLNDAELLSILSGDVPPSCEELREYQPRPNEGVRQGWYVVHRLARRATLTTKIPDVFHLLKEDDE